MSLCRDLLVGGEIAAKSLLKRRIAGHKPVLAIRQEAQFCGV